MTREELRKYEYQWIDEEALVERMCQFICDDCPAWHYERDTGARYCPTEDPTLDSCVRWYEADSYLEVMVQADKRLCEVFGRRHD